MFRAVTCPSSGGQIVVLQHLVSSLSVNGCTVCWMRADSAESALNAMPWPLYPWERPGTHCMGGWVGPRAGLGGCRNSRPHWDSIPGVSSL